MWQDFCNSRHALVCTTPDFGQSRSFLFYHWVHALLILQGDLWSWQSDSPLLLRQDMSDFMV